MSELQDTIDAIREAIFAIEKELGITPKTIYGNVRTRLDILESRINNPYSPSPNVENPFIIGNDGVTISTGLGQPTENRVDGSLFLSEDGYGAFVRISSAWEQLLSNSSLAFDGDISGDSISQTVIGLQNVLISSETPTDGYVLTYNLSEDKWKPNRTYLSGDIDGYYDDVSVIKIQGTDVSSAVPDDGYVLTYNLSLDRWEPAQSLGVNSGALNVDGYNLDFTGPIGVVTTTFFTTTSCYLLRRIVVRTSGSITGAGSAVIRIGSTSGGDEILLDTVAITSSTTDKTAFGLQPSTEYGSDMLSAQGFEAYYTSVTNFTIQVTITGGSITQGNLIITWEGLEL